MTTITITKLQNKCHVEWPLEFNDHVINRDYWFTPVEDVITDIKNDPDYNNESIIVKE